MFGDTDYLVLIVEVSCGELAFTGDPVPLGDSMGIGRRESDTELKAKLDVAIASMKEDGSLNELVPMWFGNEAPSY